MRASLGGKNIVQRVLIALAAVVIAAASLVFIAPLFISTEVLQKQALAQVESATGYRIRIDGPVKIAVFPSLGLVAREVGIAQPGQDGAAEFATARTLRFGLVLRSLLAGKVNLTEVTLVDPVVTLPLPEKAASEAADPAGEGTATRKDLSIHELTIRNGTVVLPGENGEPGKKITSLNAEATLPTATGPLTFVASASHDGDGDPVTAKGTIGSFAHFLDGGPVPVTLVLEAPDQPDGAILTGTASYKDDVLNLVQFSARSGRHKLSGNATYGNDTLTIAQGMFDNTPFAGTAHLAGDMLTVDTEFAVEGKPVQLSGSLGAVDQFLAGGAAPIKLSVVAREHLKDAVTLNGAVSYRNDTVTLPEFTAVSGEDAITGAVVYKDDVLALSQINASLGGQTITGDAAYRADAVDLNVTVVRDGKAAKVSGSIMGVEKLLDGAFASIKLEIDAPDRLPTKAIVTGDANYKDDALGLTGFNAVFGDTTVTGNGVYKDDVLILDPVKAQTSGQTASGALQVNLAGKVPNVTGTLTATGALKSKSGGTPAANETEPAAQTKPQASAQTKPAAAQSKPAAAQSKPAAAQSKPAAAQSKPAAPASNPLAQLPGGETEVVPATPPSPEKPHGNASPAAKPAKTAKTGRGIGWRVEKLGLLALRDMNADVTVTFNQFVLEDIHVGAATVKVTLASGKLTAVTKDLQAYGGGGTITLVLDSSGSVPVNSLNLAVTGVDAYPLLNDIANFQTIDGKAAIALGLTASGESEHALVSSLSGTAKFEFTDGALRGLNVASMLRTLTTGILTGWQYKSEAKTVFSKLGANFKIADGQAQTDDLRMIGPLVSIGGAGSVDLPAQRLKFRVNPFMLAKVENQSGKNNMLGFPVPIAVSGPWDKPAIYPDVVGVLENPVAAYQQLNKLGGGLIAMPTNLLGIDTGDGGLVEKSIAIPSAVTKGVVGGIGQMLGVKKRDDPKLAPSALSAPDPAASAAQPGETGPGTSETPQAPTAEAAQKEEPAPTTEAAPQEKPAPEPAPNRTFQNSFGQ